MSEHIVEFERDRPTTKDEILLFGIMPFRDIDLCFELADGFCGVGVDLEQS